MKISAISSLTNMAFMRCDALERMHFTNNNELQRMNFTKRNELEKMHFTKPAFVVSYVEDTTHGQSFNAYA